MSEHYEPYRRLSPLRVAFAILMLAGISIGTVFGAKQWQTERKQASQKPWFAAYADVTAKPTYAFEELGTTPTHEVMLAFVVSLPSDACTPAWGGAYTLDQATASLDLDRRIARLRQQGGNVAVSFGGLKNDELAVKCTDEAKLLTAYKSVIDRYNIDTVDFDLEQGGLTNTEAALRRARVIAKLQAERRAQSKNLAVWVTLPVAPQGLTQDGTNAVSHLLKAGVDLAGVNVMTMDYGDSLEEGESMLDGSKDALNNMHRQLGILYDQAGKHLTSGTLWSKIGATPMIGQNDVEKEVFTLDDAKGLNQFALSKGMSRISMWSANRDIPCGGNYVDLKVVSDSCSGVKQDKQGFTTLLSAGLEGTISRSAGILTIAEPKTAQETDDPAKSPYQIWSKSSAYLQGTKVVWHRNVYEAKWWTQGDVPDNPVLQTWETPWKLVGPVLPGETPIKQATLPPGTYPQWSGDAIYDTGQRVMFNSLPYQAKWWNKGESPATSSSNPDSSAWAPLTQVQINEIMENKAGIPTPAPSVRTSPIPSTTSRTPTQSGVTITPLP